MNYFTIRDIENLCNIKAHTLRVWEQRYGICRAKRRSGNHRIYYNEDLKELLRISFLYHNGYKISVLARFSNEEIERAVQSIRLSECNYQDFVTQLLEACIDFDQERFDKIVHCLVLRMGIDKCITGVFYPFLERVGMLWLTNHVIPAQEHFSSNLIQKKIIMALDGLDKVTDRSHNILLFTPCGEYHEIPLLVAQYFFKKQLLQTTYLGIDSHFSMLEYYCSNRPVSHFYFHVINKSGSDKLTALTDRLCRQYPDKKIIAAGPAAGCIKLQHPNFTVLRSMEELMRFASSLRVQAFTSA